MQFLKSGIDRDVIDRVIETLDVRAAGSIV